MKALKGVLLFLLAISWCALQTLVGGILALVLLPKARYSKYRGMIIVYHPFSFTFSLGTFAFVSERAEHPRDMSGRMYGYYVLSLAYGPLYFLVIALPRLFVRIPPIARYRAERGRSPEDFFADRQAARMRVLCGE